MNSYLYLFFGVLSLLPIFGLGDHGDVCSKPEVTSDVYTTTEATVSAETVVIIQFKLKCNGKDAKDLNLYAEFNGHTFPASRVEGLDGLYQVSWSDQHKNIPSGTYNVNVFDEEGHSDYKKAQRSGDDTSIIKSLFAVTVSHPGANRGLGIPTELLATLVAGGVWYLAYATKNKLS